MYILVLDQLDLFATLQSGKQSLLYFLFDLLHHPDLSMGIIGTTTRLDCISLLEKRVISRFSQIQIQFYPPEDIFHYLLLVQQRLLISPMSTKKHNLSSSLVKEYNESVQVGDE